MKNAIRLGFVLMLIVNATVIGWGLYEAFWPMRTIEIIGNDKILNPGKQVRPGEALLYQITYCKYTDKQATVTRTLKGGLTNYPLPDSTNNIPVGCHTAVVRNTIVPEGVAAGTYRLTLSATYELTSLHRETVSHVSEPFQVIAK